MRTVLMTTDTAGGVWPYSIELAEGLAADGWRVVLAAMGSPPTATQRAQIESLPALQFHALACRLEWMDEPWEDVASAGRWLLGLADRVEPDLIHLNQFAFGALGFQAPVVVVGHSSVTSWWRAVRGCEAPACWNRYRAAVTAGVRGADVVVAPSATMLRFLEDDVGPLARAAVIPNARNPAQFRPGVKEPMVFAAGRLWDPGKGLDLLERIAPQVDWPIHLAGPGNDDDERPGVATVHYLGEVAPTAVADHMGRASIFIHPCWYEPFGLAVLEAGLAGCALVLSDIASLREIWGEAAIYVPAGNERGFTDAIRRLTRDPTLRQRLAQAARQRALCYSPRRMLDGYLALYRAALLLPRGVLACGS
jgi:glycosyltransferase involved in cell wall biosynthesis